MAHYNVTLNIAHDPFTWRESRYFEQQKFTFNTFADIQRFASEKLADKSLPHSGGHYIDVVPVKADGHHGRLMLWKYARWNVLATGNYSHMDVEAFA